MTRTNARTKKIVLASAAVTALVAGGAAVAVAQQDPGTPDLDGAAEAALAEVGDGHVTGVEQDDDGGYDVEIRRPDGTETDVDLNASFEVVRTESEHDDDDDHDDDDERPLDEATRTQAADAALAGLGDQAGADSVVVSVESDDGGYDVEIRHADGTETEVDLDAEFNVIGTERDDD